MKEFILKDVSETRKWGAEFAKTLHAPCVVALHGDLGMGKSEIARAIIQTLCGADTVVPSPTFTLVQSYDVSFRGAALAANPESGGVAESKNDFANADFGNSRPHPIPGSFAAQMPRDDTRISHFDLYRITDASELEEIGLNHACANDITLIEWPEIAADFLPANTIHIYLEELEGGRKLKMTQ